MGVVKRATKGSALTWAEIDGNWDELIRLLALSPAPGTLVVNTDALVVNASKRVIVGPGADDAINILQVNGSVKTTASITINSADSAMLMVNVGLDKFPQLGLYENNMQKWNIYNDYTNDNLVFGNSLGQQIKVTQAGNLLVKTATDNGVDAVQVTGSIKATGVVDGSVAGLKTVVATPASAAAPGSPGLMFVDANYLYICVATNTWRRAPFTTW